MDNQDFKNSILITIAMKDHNYCLRTGLANVIIINNVIFDKKRLKFVKVIIKK